MLSGDRNLALKGFRGRSPSLAASEDSLAPWQHTPSCEGGRGIQEALHRKPDLLIDGVAS